MQYEISQLKEIRKQLNLSQTEFAKQSGVSQSLIAKIEAGHLDPSYSKVKMIFETIDRLSHKQEISAKEIMQKGIITVKPSEPLIDIVAIMNKKAISQVPVIDGKQIIGLITEKEILEKMGQDNIVHLKAQDVMIDPPPIISEETKISAIKSLIRYYQIIIVAKKGDFVGVITKSDLLKKLV